MYIDIAILDVSMLIKVNFFKIYKIIICHAPEITKSTIK